MAHKPWKTHVVNTNLCLIQHVLPRHDEAFQLLESHARRAMWRTNPRLHLPGGSTHCGKAPATVRGAARRVPSQHVRARAGQLLANEASEQSKASIGFVHHRALNAWESIAAVII